MHTWHKPCKNQTPLWWIFEICYKRLLSLFQNHMQQEHSESAPEQRIVPYKSNQHQHNIKLCVCVLVGVGAVHSVCMLHCYERQAVTIKPSSFPAKSRPRFDSVMSLYMLWFMDTACYNSMHVKHCLL